MDCFAVIPSTQNCTFDFFFSGTFPFLIASIESWTALRIAFAYSPLATAFGAFIPINGSSTDCYSSLVSDL